MLSAVASLSVSATPAWGQCETVKLTPPGSGGADFGRSVAIDGDLAVVGDPEGPDERGAAYVFRRDGMEWVLEATLTDPSPEDPESDFGWCVAISGSRILVGAPLTWAPDYETGAAHLFERGRSGWTHQLQLLASDGEENDRLGHSVAIDGDVILIGAREDEHDGFSQAGSAYVFRHDGSDWIEEAKLVDPNPATMDLFGESVSLACDLALIGAHGDDDAWAGTGAAFIFRYDGATWNFEAQLAPEGVGSAWFGSAVSLAENSPVAVIGAPKQDGQLGALWVFRFEDEQWLREAKLMASDPVGDYAWLGFSVAVSADGETIVGGAALDWAMGFESGAAHVFRRENAQWIEAAKLTASDGKAGDFFGGSVAVSNDEAFIGAFASSGQLGAAYVFRGMIDVDCNENGQPDGCDLFDGTSQDLDGNGIPDDCECPADVDGDEDVDVLDLLLVLSAWGEVGSDIPEDINFDSVVDVLDLIEVLRNWGPC